jgi:hypothetical protein
VTVELALADAVTGGRPGVVPVTVAFVVITVPPGTDVLTRNTMLKTAVASGAAGRAAKLLLVQVIVSVPPGAGVVHTQPEGALMDWKVVLAGVAVISVVLSATSGQGLVTVMSTLSAWPALTVGG